MAATLRFSSLDDFREYVDLKSSEKENIMKRALAAAEDTVERYCRRQFQPEGDTTPVTKKFTTHLRRVARIKDLREVTSVSYFGRVLLPGDPNAGSGYDLMNLAHHEPATMIAIPAAASVYSSSTSGFAFARGLATTPTDDLVIIGKWGWSPIPEAILDAVYTMAARKIRERDASFADTVHLPEGGALSYYRQLPQSVQVALNSFRVSNTALV